MNPIEAAVREVCRQLGAAEDTWAGFAEIGHKAVDAFITALPSELQEAVRRALEG